MRPFLDKLCENWTLFSLLIFTFGLGWMIFIPPQANTLTGGRIPAPREGFLAPDLALQDSQGRMVQLSDLRGRPVLLNLWASWCPPCKEEMQAMQKVYDQYASKGFTILAINTTYQDEKASALAFAADRQLTFPILFDLDGNVSRKYQVRSMPTSFFIDSNGLIRRVVIGGPMPEALMRAEIEQMLAQAAPPLKVP